MKLTNTILAASLLGMAAANGAIIFQDNFQGVATSGQADVSNSTFNGWTTSAVGVTQLVSGSFFGSGAENGATVTTDTNGNTIAKDVNDVTFLGFNGTNDNNTGASITRTIAVTAGTTYTLHYSYGTAFGGAANTHTFLVEFGSASETVVGNTDGFQRDSLDFTAATTGNVNLTFTNTAFDTSFNQDGAIDNIVITTAAVPEPSSTALLGLGGLALILRRRK